MKIKINLFNCGVYLIRNLITGKVYVGSTIGFKKRKSEHFRYLRKNKHHSTKLQNSFNKYGKEVFKFEIIEYTAEEDLRLTERDWILHFDSFKNGYNMTEWPDTPVLGRKMSLEEKVKRGAKIVKLIDSTGNIVEGISIHSICEKNNLNRYIISNIIKNRVGFIQYKGWRKFDESLVGKPFDIERDFNEKRYLDCKEIELINPIGDLVKIKNLSKYCRENNLSVTHMHHVWTGKCMSCKGWSSPNFQRKRKLSKKFILN